MKLPMLAENLLKEVKQTSDPTDKQIAKWWARVDKCVFDTDQNAELSEQLRKLLKAKSDLKDKR